MKRSKEQQKLLKRLNEQRRRLIKKGALPSDLRTYFGVPSYTKFSELSESELQNVALKYSTQPKVTVIKNKLLPVDYVRAHNIWYGKDKDGTPKVPYKTSYYNAINSKLINNYADLNSVKIAKKKFDNKAKSLYVESVKKLGLHKEAKQISKMSNKKFWDFVQRGSGTISFEVFNATDGKGNLDTDNINQNISDSAISTLKDLLGKFTRKRR